MPRRSPYENGAENWLQPAEMVRSWPNADKAKDYPVAIRGALRNSHPVSL